MAMPMSATRGHIVVYGMGVVCDGGRHIGDGHVVGNGCSVDDDM